MPTPLALLKEKGDLHKGGGKTKFKELLLSKGVQKADGIV